MENFYFLCEGHTDEELDQLYQVATHFGVKGYNSEHIAQENRTWRNADSDGFEWEACAVTDGRVEQHLLRDLPIDYEAFEVTYDEAFERLTGLKVRDEYEWSGGNVVVSVDDLEIYNVSGSAVLTYSDPTIDALTKLLSFDGAELAEEDGNLICNIAGNKCYLSSAADINTLVTAYGTIMKLAEKK